MNEQALGAFLLLLSLLFAFSYVLAGIFERLKIPGILAALFVAMGAHYTPIAPLLTEGMNGRIFTILADLGVLFLLLFIGLQINMKAMARQGRDIGLATVLNTAVPFVLGVGVMLYLDFGWNIALVIGLTCMPTAEAVIVPILDELNLVRTKIGNYIIGAGVLDDVIEVFLVATVSVWIGAKYAPTGAGSAEMARIVTNSAIFTAVAWAARSLILVPLSHWMKPKVPNLIMLMIIVLFIFGGFAEYVGLGLVVGAIVAGMLMRPVFAAAVGTGEQATKAVRAVSYGFFGIIFFLWIGMSVDLKGLTEAPELAILLFLAAFIGKIAGIFLMVPLNKITVKEAWAIGIGLNARLTTEIIVAKLLLDARLIGTDLFSALVAASSLSTIIVPLAFSFIASRWRRELSATAKTEVAVPTPAVTETETR